MKIKSYAKLNIALDIVKPLPNGLHQLDMVNCLVDLYDKIRVTKQKSGITLICDDPELRGEDNLVVKAAKLFLEEQGINSGVRIKLKKRIPRMAGLGGGSSNAAMTLLALNRMFKRNLSLGQLSKIASRLGADVPYFLTGGWARVQGYGQIVTPLEGPKPFWVLIVKPEEGIATGECYRTYDQIGGAHPNVGKVLEVLTNPEHLPFFIDNSLQQAAISLVPAIASICDTLRHLQFPAVALSGSGSAIFAFAPHLSTSEMKKRYQKVKSLYKEVYLVKTLA